MRQQVRAILSLFLFLALTCMEPAAHAAFTAQLSLRQHSIGGSCGNSIVDGAEACDDGNNIDGDACSADCTRVLTFDYRPGVSTSTTHALPPCTAGNGCILQCTAFSSGALWRCVDGSGNAQTVVAGTETAVTNPWGLQAIRVFADADAPTITAPSATLTNFITSPHTIIFTGFGTNSGAANFPFEINNGTDFFYFRDEGGSTKCDWTNIASGGTTSVDVVVSSTSATYNKGYGMLTARKAGSGAASTYTCRINGEQVTNSSFAKDPAALTGATFYFGKHRTSANLNPKGQSESLTVYNVVKTDAEVSNLEAGWDGVLPQVAQTTNPLIYVGHDEWMLTPAGQYFPMGYNVPRVTSAGYLNEMLTGNGQMIAGNNQTNFATNNLDVSSWTAVGTPTNAVNVLSGPFSSYGNAAECDRIVDADAGTFDGYKSPISLGTYKGPVTYNYIVAQGDSGVTRDKAHLVITTNGAGSTTCNKTIAVGAGPGGTAIYSCTANITGSPTVTTGEIDVGNVAGDTGSIIVCAAWADGHPWTESPRVPHPLSNPTTTGAGSDILKAGQPEVAAWRQRGHDEQIIFTPFFNWSDIVSFADPKTTGHEPLDLFNVGQNDHRVIFYHVTNEGVAQTLGLRGNGVLGGNPPTDTDTVSTSPVSEVAGHTYAWRASYEPRSGDGTHANTKIFFDECLSGVDSCFATTLIGSSTDGSKVMPGTDWGGFNIGCRYSNSICMDGTIQRVQVWAKR